MRVLLPLLLSTCSCAAIVTGTTQKVRLVASPNDATALLDGGAAYSGVQTLELDRGRAHNVTIAKPGYRPEALTIERRMNPWVWGNLVFGPLFFVGVLVDSLTGAAGTLRPGDVTVALEPEPIHDDAEKKLDLSMERLPPPPQELAPRHPRWVVAVMDVQSSGKSPLEADTLSALGDQIRVFLAQRRVRVVDRGAQEVALRGLVHEEQRRSYDACTDSSCQIPLGKALAASHILRASIARFGTACTTNGELIDLSTEVTVAAGSTRGACSEEAFLDAAERLSEQLLQAAAP